MSSQREANFFVWLPTAQATSATTIDAFKSIKRRHNFHRERRKPQCEQARTRQALASFAPQRAQQQQQLAKAPGPGVRHQKPCSGGARSCGNFGQQHTGGRGLLGSRRETRPLSLSLYQQRRGSSSEAGGGRQSRALSLLLQPACGTRAAAPSLRPWQRCEGALLTIILPAFRGRWTLWFGLTASRRQNDRRS